ncbi:damage-inducible mutagenesis protein [Parvibaculum sp.]|uniref:ImuA family protein n=1 Tax=Parvibaculum sp. TaxID=2024848 RepID=UPI001DA2905F|nr:damage-inducible mutagenesis protein [Parvibaculum sp.]MBX3488440.1 damage-inducible mutagenesis protein [Parvibaculum sp.]
MPPLSQQDARAALVADLRTRIAGPSAEFAEAGGRFVSLGVEVIDAALPGGGLKAGALHEVGAEDYRDMGATTGFLAALAACFAENGSGPVLWCQSAQPPFDIGALYGPGLAAFGLDPTRLVLALPGSATDCLWAMEEALRSGVFAAVIGEVDGRAAALDLTATRRLQLAAEEKGTPVLLFTGHGGGAASAAVTRWRIAALPGRIVPGTEKFGGLTGASCWRAALARVRGGAPGAWNVAWHGGDKGFVLADAIVPAFKETPPVPAEARVVAFRQSA